jgi:hypothetical protein
MPGRSTEWWLELPDGTRRRVGAAGLLIGRSPDCDLVLRDPHASRRHAIAYLAADGVALVSLSGEPERVDGDGVPDGTQLSFPGLTVTVKATPLTGGPEPSWVLRHHGGGIFGVGERGLSVGDGPHDDLRIAGCAPRSAVFRVGGGQLLLEAGVSLAVSSNKGGLVRLEAGTMHRLARGNVVHVGVAKISVVVGGATYLDTTVGREGAAGARTEQPAIRLQFLPRGGRLFVTMRGDETIVYLPGRRCDLVACLLQPPGPYVPGDAIPDDTLIPRVWPGGTQTRSAVGVLLHRLRRDLTEAGLDGVSLVERAEGGGATRFVLPTSASVVVE